MSTYVCLYVIFQSEFSSTTSEVAQPYDYDSDATADSKVRPGIESPQSLPGVKYGFLRPQLSRGSFTT